MKERKAPHPIPHGGGHYETNRIGLLYGLHPLRNGLGTGEMCLVALTRVRLQKGDCPQKREEPKKSKRANRP